MKQCSVDFLFIYEVKARELENVCLLACELEHRGLYGRCSQQLGAACGSAHLPVFL